MGWLIDLWSNFFEHQAAFYRYTCWCLGLLCAIASLFQPQKRIRLIIVASFFSCATFVDTYLLPPILVLGGSTLLLLEIPLTGAFKHEKKPLNNSQLFDITCFFSSLILGSYFRLFELSTITNTFEGELSPYFAGATSLHGMFIANKGIHGPWAPLGMLFYIPIYISTSFWGTTIFAIRFASAIVGIATIAMLFVTIAKILNRRVAAIASLLLALNSLHIGWGRTDIHPHGVTAWPGLLLMLATWHFFQRYSFQSACLLILSMGLTWHQYPSGQAQVIIPWIFLFLSLFDQAYRAAFFSMRRSIFVLTVLTLGSVLWYLGLPLSYYVADGQWQLPNPFTLTTQRTSWGNTSDHMSVLGQSWFVIQQSTRYFFDFLEGIIYKAPHLFHQDFLINIPHLGARTYPVFFVPFMVVGFVLSIKQIRTPWAKLILALLIASILPGILSERPYPKRMSVAYVALDCLSAIGLWHTLSFLYNSRFIKKQFLSLFCFGAVLFFTGWLSNAWFSGRQYLQGTPAEIHVAETIASEIMPSTIITTDIGKDYDEGKFFYLLLDTLANPRLQPIRLIVQREGGRTVPDHWVHSWTKLQGNESALPESFFKNHIYLLQHDALNPEAVARKIQNFTVSCEAASMKHHTIFFPKQGSFINEMTAVICTTTEP
jgi:hypothetical protein